MNAPSLDITVRVGCDMVYETTQPTPILLVFKPGADHRHFIREESLSFGISTSPQEFEDVHGNLTYRLVLPQGRTEVRHDALVSVSSLRDNHGMLDEPTPLQDLPPNLLRYTLPSRYCDSDRLLDFAWDNFGTIPHGLPRVQAICDWVHENIEYRYGSGQADLSAAEIIHRGYGVCRDFAHVGIALCRAFNLPTRYVTGHLPDIGALDSGSPMDFHAYMEVYLGGNWYTFDPRFNTFRIGRIKVAQGLDAVDGAFSTIYGGARLTYFEVWTYQVDPKVVSLRDPIDLSKRLDGTKEIRIV